MLGKKICHFWEEKESLINFQTKIPEDPMEDPGGASTEESNAGIELREI